MKTESRPELNEPVATFAERLRGQPEKIPLSELATLFGAPPEVMDRVASRGDIVFRGEIFSNDGPELVARAGKVEIEIPSLMRGTYEVSDEGFRMAFPSAEFSLRACATMAFIRKCFELKEMRATASDLVLDFGSSLADRRYTF